MKLEQEAILTCNGCRVEGPHRLLYLSGHLDASQCKNCGATYLYSEHIYADYVRDVAERGAHLPLTLARRVFRKPTELLTWPYKAVRKPVGLLKEMYQVATFERSVQRRPRVHGDRL